MRSVLGNKEGFTLLEIVVAFFILTVALLGLISLTVIVIKGNSFSKSMTTATTLARDKLEELQTTRLTSLAGGSDTVSTIYTRNWTVTANTPASAMSTIEVSVRWDWLGTQRNVTLRSIVSQ